MKTQAVYVFIVIAISRAQTGRDTVVHVTLLCIAWLTAITNTDSWLGPFSIDASNGELVLTNSLDFERVTNYTFNVRATDGGGRYDESTVQVMVVDVNDHRPVFERQLYMATIKEGDYALVPMNILSVSYAKYQYATMCSRSLGNDIIMISSI